MGLFKQIKDAAGGGSSRGSAGADLEPIAGVSLELYAELSRQAADVEEPSQVSLLAPARGVSVASWEAAVEGWNARILADPVVGRQFNLLYRGH